MDAPLMKKWLKQHETYVLLVIIAFSAVITVINPAFLTLENMFDLLKSYSFIGIFAVGVTFVLISGGIDISFTAVATVAEYVMAVVIIRYGGNMFIAFLIVVVVGVAYWYKGRLEQQLQSQLAAQQAVADAATTLAISTFRLASPNWAA